jgi:hypothetical protein
MRPLSAAASDGREPASSAAYADRVTITTHDPRETNSRTAEPHRLRHTLDETRSTERLAVSLCGRQAIWQRHGGTAHPLDGAADCVVCLDLDGRL